MSERIRRVYLGIVGCIWFALFLLGIPEVGTGDSFDMVPVGGLAVIAGFSIACLVVALGHGKASRLAVLCLASGLPMWLSGRIWLRLISPGEWDAVLLPLSLPLIVLPFLLVAYALRKAA